MDRQTDRWKDRQTYSQISPLFYTTSTSLGPLSCLCQNCHCNVDGQGKGIAYHLLPLGQLVFPSSFPFSFHLSILVQLLAEQKRCKTYIHGKHESWHRSSFHKREGRKFIVSGPSDRLRKLSHAAISRFTTDG